MTAVGLTGWQLMNIDDGQHWAVDQTRRRDTELVEVRRVSEEGGEQTISQQEN